MDRGKNVFRNGWMGHSEFTHHEKIRIKAKESSAATPRV